MTTAPSHRVGGTTAARWPRGSPCSRPWRSGVSIAILSPTAYVVMRQQLMSSLDQSLLNRAHKATADTTLSEITARGAPPWVLGAADVRIIFVTAEGRGMSGDGHP